MAITLKQPAELKGISDEVWNLITEDIKKDNEFIKLCKRYNIAELECAEYMKYPQLKDKADKTARKMQEIERQAMVRLKQYSHWWIKKYGDASISVQELVQILKGEPHDQFVLRANTVLFLADFMEDCFVEMNSCIKKQFPDAKYEPLKDFFALKNKLSAYLTEILDSEGENFRALFDTHATPLKMTIYNKVNGFLNANEQRILKEENEAKQLTLNFDNNE